MKSDADSYFTIVETGLALIKDKGSKFLGFAYGVKDEGNLKEHLSVLRKQYYDATHHCYAYLLGHLGEKFRANDDGEPGHSAGDPILGQLRAFSLTNSLVVVVRYFGGTKLGVSGLIQAYKQAAYEAISNAVIAEKFVTAPINIDFSYRHLSAVMKIIKEYDMVIEHQHMESSCSFQLTVKRKFFEEARQRLAEIYGVNFLK